MGTIRNAVLKNTGQKRKPYHTPEIEAVLLVPEENVLGGCHTTLSNTGPEGAGCQGPIKCVNLEVG